ncbi:MAG TPA: YraN family protein [Spirochaetia bacterium]|nr:YraN family protein [Spirochaetia bacterium]HBI37893.1 YraN family protein [Spirochaetia bacterium]
MLSNVEKGRLGEMIASEILEYKGVDIVGKNYRTKFGEIDLIGIEKKTIIFIEVRLRTGNSFGIAEESISVMKEKRLRLTIDHYLINNNIDNNYRFDVITINTQPDLKIFNVTWFKNQEFN